MSQKARNKRLKQSRAVARQVSHTARTHGLAVAVGAFLLIVIIYLFGFSEVLMGRYAVIAGSIEKAVAEVLPEPKVLDTEEYDRRMHRLANYPPEIAQATTTATSTATTTAPVPKRPWPAEAAYPNPDALLPFRRIVAYYGNFYSTRMGALGEYEADEMLARLMKEVDRWEKADPDTPVIPAIDYIAVTAQGNAGEDGMYRLRMPDDQIEHALTLADRVDGIVILEVQVGLSDLQHEIELLEPFLKLPQVHLAIDPEFHMTRGNRPGTVIGTVDATEVNAAAEYLAALVREHDLPPKVLIVHRFTQNMVTNYRAIEPLPEVQIVIDMDGWGSPAKKFGTYNHVVAPEPVQFTGFKIFYKNDLKSPSDRLLTPEDLLELQPIPIFIQYQ